MPTIFAGCTSVLKRARRFNRHWANVTFIVLKLAILLFLNAAGPGEQQQSSSKSAGSSPAPFAVKPSHSERCVPILAGPPNWVEHCWSDHIHLSCSSVFCFSLWGSLDKLQFSEDVSCDIIICVLTSLLVAQFDVLWFDEFVKVWTYSGW